MLIGNPIQRGRKLWGGVLPSRLQTLTNPPPYALPSTLSHCADLNPKPSQEMRTYKEAEQAGKTVGFELVDSRDIADTSPPCALWCALYPIPCAG